MRELELLEHIYRRSSDLTGARGIEVGPGDDCAVICFGTHRVLITTDQLVAGRHYDPAATSLDLIARKAVARSVSDIAAMAGTPRFAVATGAIGPDCPSPDNLFDCMSKWARHWDCPLVGGDIAAVQGPTVLTVTVLGDVHPARGPVLRSGAKPGDVTFVTGAIGGSLASNKHHSFEPRLSEAAWLASEFGDELHAMIDVSDGLGLDADRIARASSLRLDLRAADVPLSPGINDWKTAIADGEDYELLFVIDARAADRLPPQCPDTGTTFSRIGSCHPGEGAFIIDPAGTPLPAKSFGWEHRA